MLELVVNGVSYTDFTDIELGVSLTTLSGAFSFKAVAGGKSVITNAFPIKQGDSCTVLVDGVTKLTGFVEIINVAYSSQEHSISIQGRDKTGDVIDATVGANFNFDSGITLERVISQSLETAGITGIEVINNAGTIRPFEAGELVQGSVGDSLQEFFELYARKRQVLLTTDGLGNIVLARAEAILIQNTTLLNELGGVKNNIKAANVTYNDSERYNTYVIHSQGNPSALNIGGLQGSDQLEAALSTATDATIRTSRTLNMLAENSSSNEECTERAIWQSNIDRVRSFTYEVTLAGHSIEQLGTDWILNRLIPVIDDFADVDATLLINDIVWRYSVTGGSTTALGLVEKDAYLVELSEPVPAKQTDTLGLNL